MATHPSRWLRPRNHWRVRGLLARNPVALAGDNPAPPARAVRVFTVGGTRGRTNPGVCAPHPLGRRDRAPPGRVGRARTLGPRSRSRPAHGSGNENGRERSSSSGAPAVEASGVSRPARLYDLRATFASNALAAGVTPFELGENHGDLDANVGTSLRDPYRRGGRGDRRPSRRPSNALVEERGEARF